ncbi:MAG: His-Xaa-Ser system radical SAM maturase HxsB [Candidatus Marinimicrobia bacterium]|jgi:His-Xaa-Ser system radical SAM maturase HxsB|nr:His-Xaa-Ser system radical SAM maturase HxsB [Candidatus Neomarinimicrobiota bacterium]|tara:strand:- start:1118 stop:2740 length:1623 start_codon:yes stop_codon:yes gene_type:complete
MIKMTNTIKLSKDFYSPSFISECNSSNGETLQEVAIDDKLRENANRLLIDKYNQIIGNPVDEISSFQLSDLPAVNYFRSLKISEDEYFISVDTGNWMIISKEDYELLKKNTVNKSLSTVLEKNFILLTEKNIDSYINKLRIRYGFLTEGPTLHIVVVTSNCNLSCIYCQASASNVAANNMNQVTANETVDRIFESPSDSFIIEFQGGEPLMNFPAIKNIIQYANRRAERDHKQVEYSLITNFTSTVTKEKLIFLMENNVSISFSLDGSKELHEKNRGRNYPNAFEILEKKVALYKKIWASLTDEPVELNALMTTTTTSLPLFREIIDTYLNFGITQINIRSLTPLGKALDTKENLVYTPEEFVDFWKNSVGYVLELRAKGIEISEFFLELILTKLFGNETGFMDLRSPCGAGYGQITYNYDGQVYTCDEGRMIYSDYFQIGSIYDQQLNNILLDAKTQSVFESSILEQYYCDYCAFKPYCGVCPVLHLQQKDKIQINVLETGHCEIFFKMIQHIVELFINDENAREEFQKMLMNVNWQKN